jgi:putative permease
MVNLFKQWYQKNFSDPDVIFLTLSLFIGCLLVYILSNTLIAFLVAIVMGYLLDGPITFLEEKKIPRIIAVTTIFFSFILFCIVITFGLVPLLSQQVSQLIAELPNILTTGQARLLELPELYPSIFTEPQVRLIIDNIGTALGTVGKTLFSFSIANVVNVFTLAVYAFLIPMMMFFILKDKKQIIEWFCRFIPQQSKLSRGVWKEVDGKIANYIGGKFVEIGIIWVTNYILFAYLDLHYSLLLSFLVGLSVIIPFVGVVIITVPVAIIGYIQFGTESAFYTLMITFVIIQIIDGNIVVPLLFSEAVNIHPLAIIVAVLFFGGIWGVWGIFFAIPLATLIQAVLNSWPQEEDINKRIRMEPEYLKRRIMTHKKSVSKRKRT